MMVIWPAPVCGMSGGFPSVPVRPVRAQMRERSPDPAIIRARLVPLLYGPWFGRRVISPHGPVITEQIRKRARVGPRWSAPHGPLKDFGFQHVAWFLYCLVRVRKTSYARMRAHVYAHTRTRVKGFLSIFFTDHGPRIKRRLKHCLVRFSSQITAQTKHGPRGPEGL